MILKRYWPLMVAIALAFVLLGWLALRNPTSADANCQKMWQDSYAWAHQFEANLPAPDWGAGLTDLANTTYNAGVVAHPDWRCPTR